MTHKKFRRTSRDQCFRGPNIPLRTDTLHCGRTHFTADGCTSLRTDALHCGWTHFNGRTSLRTDAHHCGQTHVTANGRTSLRTDALQCGRTDVTADGRTSTEALHYWRTHFTTDGHTSLRTMPTEKFASMYHRAHKWATFGIPAERLSITIYPILYHWWFSEL